MSFFKLGKISSTAKANIKTFTKYLVKTVIGWSGPQGLITYIFLDFLLKKGWILLTDLYWYNKIKKDEEQKGKQAEDSYESVINDKTKSSDEVHQAVDDLFNR